MDTAAPERKDRADIETDDFTPRVLFADDGEHVRVSGMVGRRHEHEAVPDVEVGVWNRPPFTADLDERQHRNLDDLEQTSGSVGRAASPARVHVQSQPVALLGLIATLENHDARARVHGDVVDVAVGVVVVRKAVRQPDDRTHAEFVAENFLDVELGEVRVAIGVHQALDRRDQRALAIDGE